MNEILDRINEEFENYCEKFEKKLKQNNDRIMNRKVSRDDLTIMEKQIKFKLNLNKMSNNDALGKLKVQAKQQAIFERKDVSVKWVFPIIFKYYYNFNIFFYFFFQESP